jgi:hypothetical protein
VRGENRFATRRGGPSITGAPPTLTIGLGRRVRRPGVVSTRAGAVIFAFVLAGGRRRLFALQLAARPTVGIGNLEQGPSLREL